MKHTSADDDRWMTIHYEERDTRDRMAVRELLRRRTAAYGPGWIIEIGRMGICTVEVSGPVVPDLRRELERMIAAEGLKVWLSPPGEAPPEGG